jgi:hypothetical protein
MLNSLQTAIVASPSWEELCVLEAAPVIFVGSVRSVGRKRLTAARAPRAPAEVLPYEGTIIREVGGKPPEPSC